MSETVLLSEEIITDELEDLPLWTRQGNSIIREFSVSDFPATIGLANAIAVISEAMGHHPDILIYGWNKLRTTVTSHDAGGLTESDFKLAKRIEELKF